MPNDANDPDVNTILRSFELLTRPPIRDRPRLPAYQPPTNAPEPPRMGLRFAGRSAGHIPAYLMAGGRLTNEGLYRVGDMDFNALATPWERQWSKLCPGGFGFVPVVMQTPQLEKLSLGTVAGHRGRVMHSLLVAFGSPTVDWDNGGLVVGDGLMFVADYPHSGLPPGARLYGPPRYEYDVFTTVDGQVLAVLDSKDHDVLQDAN